MKTIFFSVAFCTFVQGFLTSYNGKGLDINCWTGETTTALQKKYPDLQFEGIDSRETVIQVAKKRYANMNFTRMNLEDNSQSIDTMFRLIQISNYQELPTLLERAWASVEDEGLLIVKYHIKDATIIEQYKHLLLPTECHIWSDRQTAVWRK
ncbi:MAG: hypothetical protein CMM15_04980 [Rhodospirillaceae bacterium]|nr:hypothetical protein [Rhodospirillaceae bacterium]